MEFDISKAVEKIVMQAQENQEEFIFETIRPYCENILQMKINKEELKQILLNGTQKQTSCEDYISRQEIIDEIDRYIEKAQSTGTKDDFISFQELIVKQLPSVTPKAEWIPVKIREMTPEEIEEIGLDNGVTTMFDCPLPDDGEEVLVTTPWGVNTTTFYEDYGCYFEYYEDDGDVLAWMRLPKGYKPEQAQPHMMCEED